MSRRLPAGALGLAGGLGAAAIAAVGLLAVYDLHFPVPLRDLVDLQLPFLQGQDLLSVLPRVHVDHLVVFQRLLAWIDLHWLRGEVWASLGATLISCGALGLLVAQAAQDGPEPDAILVLDANGRIEAVALPTPGVQPDARPPVAPDLGWELWVTPTQRTEGRLMALRSGELCPLAWP